MGSRGPGKGTDSAKAGKGYARITVGNGIPPPPSFLGKVGQEEYLRMAELMTESWTPADFPALASYAASYEEYVRLHIDVRDEGANLEGDRGVVLNPKVKALDLAAKRMLKMVEALGLTRKAASATPNAERGVPARKKAASASFTALAAEEAYYDDDPHAEDYTSDA